MPVVSVKKRELCAALGRDYDEEDFQKLCFDFGIELDDVLIEGEEEESGAGPAAGGGAADGAAGEVVWKIEIPANRYDLLCVEGIGSALRTFIGLAGIPVTSSLPTCAVSLRHLSPVAPCPARTLSPWQVSNFFVYRVCVCAVCVPCVCSLSGL
jgi:phenylalanyl-tRNA synthetase beta chain